MGKKAVIFDMDGVLIDSEPVYIEMFRTFLLEHDCRINEALLMTLAGASARETWRIMAELWYEKIDPEELHRQFRREYPDFQIDYRAVMYPGVLELLRWLKERGVIMAVASSSSEPSIRRMFEETGFGPYFSFLVSGKQFRESKSDPEIYLYTLSRLGLPKEDCLVVEDSVYGIQAAKAAGLKVVAVRDQRFSFDQSAADRLIDRVADLKEIFEEL